jgi:hypothetical protein
MQEMTQDAGVTDGSDFRNRWFRIRGEMGQDEGNMGEIYNLPRMFLKPVLVHMFIFTRKRHVALLLKTCEDSLRDLGEDRWSGTGTRVSQKKC